MTASQWRVLWSALEIQPPWGEAVRKPTDEAIAEYERQSGFLLPPSYREFAKVFGPGELAEGYKVRTPGSCLTGRSTAISTFNHNCDLAEFNRRLRRPSNPLGPDVINDIYNRDKERISRLVCFADSMIGEVIGWDPLDIRDQANGEYGIFIIVRENDHASFLSPSFAAFVHDVCYGARYFELFGDAERADPRPQTFRPAAYPRHHSPDGTTISN